MFVAILGGTKFFGARLVKQLAEKQHSVVVFSRVQTLPSELQAVLNVTHVSVDLSLKANESAAERIQRIKAVFDNYPFEVLVDNISMEGSDVETFVSAMAEKQLKQYILCSSVAIYPAWNKSYPDFSQLFREKNVDLTAVGYSPVNTSQTFKDFYSFYVMGKRGAEMAAREQLSSRNIPLTVFRPSVIEGANDPFMRTWYWVQRLLDEGPILYPETNFPTLYKHVFVDDVATVFAESVGNQSAYNQTFNLSGDKILTVREYIEDLANKLGINPASRTFVGVDPDIIYSELSGFDFPPFYSDVALLSDNTQVKRHLNVQFMPYDNWMQKIVDGLLHRSQMGDIPASQGYQNRQLEIDYCQQIAPRANLGNR